MEMTRIRPEAALVHSIIDALVDETKQLKDVVAAHGITLAQFRRYVAQDKEAAAALRSAWEFQAHVLVDEARHIADTSADPAKARNQIDIRKWMAERRARQAYGQQIDITVAAAVDINTALAMADSRLLRPVRDQLANDQAETLDVPSRIVQSVDNGELPARAETPDIFS